MPWRRSARRAPPAEPAGRSFASEDDEAHYYLDLLRDGADDEKAAARDGLARIFERRGMFQEVVELYEGNQRSGVRDARSYERLAVAYRRLGDHKRADEAMVEARRLVSSARPLAARPLAARSPDVRSLDSRRAPAERPTTESSTAEGPTAERAWMPESFGPIYPRYILGALSVVLAELASFSIMHVGSGSPVLDILTALLWPFLPIYLVAACIALVAVAASSVCKLKLRDDWSFLDHWSAGQVIVLLILILAYLAAS